MADAITMAQMLIDKRANVHGQMTALLDDVQKRGADAEMTAEEAQKFDRLNADMNALQARADALVKFDADAKAVDEELRKIGVGRESGGAAKSISEQVRALANGEVRSLELRTESQDFIAAQAEVRALSKGTATAGGNTVPTTFVRRLYEHLIETATLLRGGATVLNTTTGENIDMPVTTAHGTGALVLEAGTIPQADPAFGKRTLGAYKYGDLILVPNELLTDTAVDLEGYLARQAGRAVGNALGAHLVSGTGSSQPAGITTSATVGVTGGTGVAGAPTFDNLIDLVYSVIGPYRNSPNAAFMIKDTTAGALRKLKDSSGRYLWEPTVTAGVPDRMLSYPVLTDPYMPATAVNALSVLFGDLSTYYVRLVNGVRFERSDEFKFDTDQVAFRCLIRGDGLLLDQSGAVKAYKGAAT